MTSKNLISLGLVVCFACGAIAAPAWADTTETSVTKTITNSRIRSVVELPAGGTYVLLDPATSTVERAFDPAVVEPMPTGTVVIDKLTGKVVAVIQSGKLVQAASIPATDPVVAAIDARFAEIQRMISQGLNWGTVTPAQATAWRSELESIAHQESAVKRADGTLSYSDALSLAYLLNSLTRRACL